VSKDKAILEEKLNNLEGKRDENRGRQESELNNLRDTVAALNEQIAREREASLFESDRLKSMMQENER